MLQRSNKRSRTITSEIDASLITTGISQDTFITRLKQHGCILIAARTSSLMVPSYTAYAQT